MTTTPAFPPLMKGLATGDADPFAAACDRARRGVDAGLVAWAIDAERLRAALVLAPETPLELAMAAMIACAVGLQNALGVLAPPEVAVHLEWWGGVRLNGARCGALAVAASHRDPAAVPDWLVVALDLDLALPATAEPGQTPDRTALAEEGCAEIDPVRLLEAWARHSLVWLSDLDTTEGRAKLHREWSGLLWQLGEELAFDAQGTRLAGKFLGIDENFGMLMRPASGATRLIALSSLIVEA